MKVSQLNRPLIRGHVWLVRFQPWDPDREDTIEKYAVILQEGTYFRNYESVCVVLLTTTPPRRPRPTDVLIPPGEHTAEVGVWANCGQVWTIPVDDLMRYTYQLSSGTMNRIDVALTVGLGMAPQSH